MAKWTAGRGKPGVPAKTGPAAPAQAPMLDLGDGTLVSLKPGMSIKTEPSYADICIVFDTTGSMSDKIDGLIACMSDFVDQLGKLSVDWRISVLPFGDLTVPGDRVELQWPFVQTVQQAKKQLSDMPRFSGGGNEGESAIDAILGATGKSWRKGAVRLAVLLTDEPALGVHRNQQVLAKLRGSEIITFVASPNIDYYRSWASATGGKWFQIGQSMDTAELLALLRRLVKDVAKVVADVKAIAGGSYKRYLEITEGDNRRPNKR